VIFARLPFSTEFCRFMLIRAAAEGGGGVFFAASQARGLRLCNFFSIFPRFYSKKLPFLATD
jgi:hypothetical protein